MLLFEGQWWKQNGSKEDAVRRTFGTSYTTYLQRLNRALNDPRALAEALADPSTTMITKRLRRKLDDRGRHRS